MKIIKFRNSGEHSDLLHKVKRMKKFTEELEDMLEECYEDEEAEYRSGSYHKDYDEDDDMRMEGRYGYRRSGKRM